MGINDPIVDAIVAESETISCKRPQGGTFTLGRWTEAGAPVDFTITGAKPQPLQPKELERLEDSRHVRAAIRTFTADTLRTVQLGSSQPDIIVHDSIEYEVEKVGEWIGVYQEVIAVLREK